MREIIGAVLYLTVAAALISGLAIGAVWLSTPDPTLVSVKRAPPPIPPRIAESIERKATPFPSPEPEVSVMRPITRPVMREAPVSLPVPPVKRVGKVAPRKQRQRKVMADTGTAEAAPAALLQRPTTVRNDAPY